MPICNLKKKTKIITSSLLLIVLITFQGCGKAYFPIELKTKSRSERLDGQQELDVSLVSLTEESLKKANKTKYVQRIIDSGNLEKPAKLIAVKDALIEKLPLNNNPGQYTVGIGDVISISELIYDKDLSASTFNRSVKVSDDGFINVMKIGRLSVEGLSQTELEDLISKRYLELGARREFEISLAQFNSKRIFLGGDSITSRSISYTNVPIFLHDVLAKSGISKSPGFDSKISIHRDGNLYTVSLIKVMSNLIEPIRLFPNDRIYIEKLTYRKEAVIIAGETGAQRSVVINSIERPTLAETVFRSTGNILNIVSSDFSQIYVIRQKKERYIAYHLDITNPARIDLANKFEMRPDDIIFVATQPLALYSRTLSQILGSTGLTLQARDTIRTEIGN